LRAEHAADAVSGEAIAGYHMHMGETTGPDRDRPFATIAGAGEGARSADGRVMGTYLHGLFAADAFRRAFLDGHGSDLGYEAGIEATLDALARHLETHLDLDALLALARG
jgi:adenosylcobyric acid synthase